MEIDIRAAFHFLMDLGIEDPLQLKPVVIVTSLQKDGLQTLFGIKPRGESHGLLLLFLRNDLSNEGVRPFAELAMQALIDDRLFQYFVGEPEYLKILEYIILMTQHAEHYGTELFAPVYLSASIYMWWMTQDLSEEVKGHLSELFAPALTKISDFQIHPINPGILRSVAALMVGQVGD